MRQFMILGKRRHDAQWEVLGFELVDITVSHYIQTDQIEAKYRLLFDMSDYKIITCDHVHDFTA